MRSRLWAGLVVAAACGGDAGSRSVVAERDSAGIRIVEHVTVPESTLRLASEPVVRIGSVAGAEAYQLHNVQSVARLSDGRIAVAHASHEIRIYDDRGRYVRSAGRQGGGPGEFTRITQLKALEHDTLLVYDAGARRATLLAPDGSYARDFPVQLSGSRFPAVVGALPDGALLVRSGLNPPAGSTQMMRDTLLYQILRGDSAVRLRTYPGPETTIHVAGANGSIESIFVSQAAFARPAHAAAAGRRFVTASADAYELSVWNDDGSLGTIVRSAHVAPRPVTDELFAEYVERELQRRRESAASRGRPFEEAEVRREIQASPRAPHVPLLAGLVGAEDGGFWVRDFSVSEDARWLVFDDTGTMRGAIALPPSFRPFLIENDVVYGVERDELDVESVRGYRVER